MVKDVEKLKDCVEIKRLYAGALESEGWPTVCDKVQGQYPPTSRWTSQQMKPDVLSHFDWDLATVPPPEKREREEDARPLRQRRKKKWFKRQRSSVVVMCALSLNTH